MESDRGNTPAPLYICGRQHSGNTVTACVFEQVPECYAVNVEGRFFEQVRSVGKIRDPQRRAARVVGLLRLDEADTAQRTLDGLIRWHAEHPDAGAVELYRQAMHLATLDRGKRFWVRRATSYVFYGREILHQMPEARMLYLLRNPYDVWASLKRRGAPTSRPAWVLGWNRGLQLALALQAEFPERFLIVRYEDMVARPVEVFGDIFEFAGVPFRERYLDVPHVNRSEAHQTRTSTTRGLVGERVYYYTGILRDHEIAAVDMVARRGKLTEYYPDLPHRGGRWPPAVRLRAVRLLLASPFVQAAHEARQLMRHDPAWRLRRLLRRLWTVAR